MQVSFLQVMFSLLCGISLIVVMTARFRVHAFFALLAACMVVGPGVGMPMDQLLGAMRDGFGNVMKSLGLIIVLGTTLGAVLEHTGSTRVMADYILRRTGERRAALAMTITGFIVGLPIFCDSGFIVLSGLNRSLSARTRIPISYMSVSLAAGLYAVHCLIPPHPGAAAAAGLIGVDYGGLILKGILVAIPAAIAGHCWARYASRKQDHGYAQEDAPASTRSYTDKPRVIQAFLPVIVPILLIAARSFLALEKNQQMIGNSIIQTLGDPVIALLTGLIIAIAGHRSWSMEKLSRLMSEAVEKSGSILVIIGAGGAFGAVLTATNMGAALSETLPLARMGILFPFLLTAVLKTAQGSSTVAIITAASIIRPLLVTLGLSAGQGPLLCVMSMGAGSMMISHANDAYFWVIARFSGLDMKTMLKVYSIATLLMGITAFLMVYILSLL